jgi:hypothetical protein
MLFEPILSIVDGANLKRSLHCCQCRFSVQSAEASGAHPNKCNPLSGGSLLNAKANSLSFCTKSSTAALKSSE